jgi:quercetin dioxygenase-like cupin family protein
MRRHPALIPLSHDHHHGLVQARRLRRAAEGGAADRREAVAAFVEFFAQDTRLHFRDEEERLFPLLGTDGQATELLARALLQHQQLRALVSELEAELAGGEVSAERLRSLGSALEEHIRFEERTLFPYIEKVTPEEVLRRFQEAEARPASAEGSGPLWGTETEDLNATLLAWPPGGGPAEHVNDERDVLVVVLAGSATVSIDGEARAVDAGEALPIPKKTARLIAAGPEGVRYLSVHTRRPPLQIAP